MSIPLFLPQSPSSRVPFLPPTQGTAGHPVVIVADSSDIKKLLRDALTDKVDDREMFMKGIDYSHYYEEQ